MWPKRAADVSVARNMRARDAVFKIEVFNALQTWFWPFKTHLSQNNLSKRNPNLKMKASLEVLDIICPSQEPHERRALSLQESGVRWLILDSSHCIGNMYHIVHAHSFVVHFYILGLTSWIWTNPSTEDLGFESPSKWNSYEGFNLEHCRDVKDWGITWIGL